MHLFLPTSLPANRPLPAAERLALEGYSIEYYPLGGELPAPKAGDRIVGVLNLMPLKEVTELDILRAIAPTEGRGNVVVMLLKFPGQTYKNTPHEHMDDFYVPVDQFLQRTKGRETAARLIVTGAPLEKIAFEEVRYWTELCQLMDEARQRKLYTLYICWAAQAALYHRYGIEKRLLPEKQFGIYTQHVLRPEHPLMQGLGGAFPMPVSRHTDIAVPAHYYPEDDPSQPPSSNWRAHAQLLYTNWLNYYVYQTTPYDIEQAGEEETNRIDEEEAHKAHLRKRSTPVPVPKPAESSSEFLRAENEDDDGYDPYSDRREESPLFEPDPWK